MTPGSARSSRRGGVVLAVAVLAATLAVACDGGGGEPAPSAVPSPSGLPTPDQVVPSEPSGFGTYTAPGGHFTVDLPSGWGVTLNEGLAVARPEGGGVDSMILIANDEVEGTDLSAVLEQLDLAPDGDARPAEVPGAVQARRFRGESFAAYELVAAVDDQGRAAVVAAFDSDALGDEQRERVLTSLAFSDGGATT